MILRRDTAATRTAEFSDCEAYRYRLRYELDGGHVFEPPARPIAFLMLNPSTATELEPDPTVRRCMGFAKAWGHSTLYVANLFALRATDPRELARHTDPVGPDNDAVLADLLERDIPVVAAWGAHRMALEREKALGHLIFRREMLCLGMTRSGAPRHPLYVPARTKPVAWRPA